MKTLFRMMVLFMLLFNFSSCSDDEEEVMVQTIDVNYANLDGVWKLTEWNGQPIAEGTYCYIDFDRKEHTFKMYQKFDSMYARCITGEFWLEEDDNSGDIIDGVYDYGMGDWNNSYIITEMLETGSMIWTVNGDETDVCKYERCDEVPDDIIAEAEIVE